MNDMEAFARLLGALRPWLHELVIVGGWCHRLHRFHPLASTPAHMPLATRDADLAFSDRQPPRGDIGEALRAAEFREELSSEHVPPITRYTLGREDAGFYAEFLVPLRGSGMRRDGSPDATLASAGITAQKLRHLDLLLVEPWTVALGPALGIPLREPVDAAVANPVGFIAQKLLIASHRAPRKRAQDALYIHDTIELFGARLPALGALWRESLRPSLPAKTAVAVEAACAEQFGRLTDTLRNAARIPQDRVIQPERLQQVCEYGLGEIFGGG